MSSIYMVKETLFQYAKAMFEQLKQFKQLKDLQDKLAKERIEVEKDGIKVVMNGKMEVQEIILNLQLDNKEQERTLKDCFNEAVKKMQMAVARSMSGLQS
ncbi:MAG: YbaB/EbfC family nucleoid-associated protein [Candidatus Wildermuthbacteria bacterium]|nr:YbaB/EbfC family nucleoid-associated protein [Candidatus Wildermuthbacteria bacterium]